MSTDTDVKQIERVLSFAPYTYKGGGTAGWTGQMRRQLAEYLVKHAVKVDDLADNNGDLPALRKAIKKQVIYDS